MKKLTEGRPIKVIFSFAIPLLFGNLFQLLYNLADTRIVGETLGSGAIAALGATSSINTVVIGFLNGLTNGFALVTARYFGAKDEKSVKKTTAASLILGFATSAALTVISLACLKPLLVSLNTTKEIFDDAYLYISIILAGMTVSMCYNICAAVLRAVGDTVTPLVFLIISTVTNIGLDLLFILGFGCGVEGAAFATLISQLLSVILCVIYIFKKYKFLIPDKAAFRFSARMAGDMYTTGLSMGLMISLVGIGTVIMQGAINSSGTDTIVSHTASRKISEMFMLPISVFGASAATFTSQNYGAGNMKAVRKGIFSSVLLTWIWSAVVIIVCWIFTPQLVHLVTGISDPSITEVSHKYMMVNTPLYFVLGIVIVFRNSLQGLGAKLSPIISSLLELAGKFAVAFYLAPRLGYFGIMLSEPLVWIGMAVILGVGLFTNKEFRKGKI
ncbi:MAG: MATE family efflux transporter [Oscillospiraceae bacterium]